MSESYSSDCLITMKMSKDKLMARYFAVFKSFKQNSALLKYGLTAN